MNQPDARLLTTDLEVRPAEALLGIGALQRAIFNSANFSSIATDARGVIQIFNVGAERMLGYTAAEVMNKITPADISDPEEVITRATALSLELGTPITPGFEALVFKASRGIEDIYELTYIRKDRTRLPAVVSVTALRDETETIIGYLLIGTDNTARKRAEAALLKVGALQNAIFNSANFSSIATDARGVIQIFNVGAERMLGYTASEVTDTITPADISDPEELIARATALSEELGTPITPGFEALVFKASRGIEDIYELTYIRKDRSRFPALVSVTALRDAQGSIIGYLLIGTDNTARKLVEEERGKLEQTLRQQNEELEDANRMKSEFLANMSHELRTPLNAIIGFSEVLRDGLVGEMTEQQRGFISDIFGSGTHLLSLINDILDLSKVEAGKMLLDLEPVALDMLLRNSLSIVREKAAERKIRLKIENSEPVGNFRADGRKLKQIIYNLLSNAVKFTAEGGEVKLRTGSATRAEVGRLGGPWAGRSCCEATGDFDDFLFISVTDTGIGMPPEALAGLFQPFCQIDSGLARRFEGTGLGLVLVRVLTELHGGCVAVESAVDEGSRFTVWLPLRSQSVTSTPARTSERQGQAAISTARTALIVEDDPKSAELIRLQLVAEGFAVLHAMSAEAGLALAEQHSLALITLDVMLPEMDGWEFLQRVRELPGLAAVPVVIVSIVADVNKGFALGAAAVMHKPLARAELYDALVELGLVPLGKSGKLKVLVVDDDPKAVEVVAFHLAGLASVLLRAYGGSQAIEMARQELPDLIVLDLMMPGVNGFDVVAALNEEKSTARIPVLVVTAKSITEEDRTRLSGHVSSILEKGDFDRHRFGSEIRRAIAGRPWLKS